MPARVSLERANPSCGLDTAEDRHLHVHHDEIKALALDGLDGFLTVLGDGYLVTHFLQKAGNQALTYGMVFSEQDAQGRRWNYGFELLR